MCITCIGRSRLDRNEDEEGLGHLVCFVSLLLLPREGFVGDYHSDCLLYE